jgi:hypothetical protein
MVCGCCRDKRGGEPQRGCFGRENLGDGAWVEHGKEGVHGEGAGGTHGMRGDGVGVGLGGAMQGRGGGREDTTSGGDSWGASRECDGGMVDGCTWYECNGRSER